MQTIAVIRLAYENKPLQNAFKRIEHYIYLFKLYSISTILLLKNNLTNICRKTIKIEINLWMVYTCNMKSSGKYLQKMGRRWMYFASLTEIMGYLWLYYTLLGKGI